jgi:hypothetical protein
MMIPEIYYGMNVAHCAGYILTTVPLNILLGDSHGSGSG